jgi:putative transposase
MSEIPFHEPGRRTPAKGVHIAVGGRPNWVFLTVCTEKRERWLAQSSVQRALHEIWERKATAWLVSDYILLPDHLHLFCSPHDLRFTIERWIAYWKDCLAKTMPEAGKFQAGGFHHRLRAGESYAQKWLYVRENPVRHKMVSQPDDWPYSGRVHEIRWAAD